VIFDDKDYSSIPIPCVNLEIDHANGHGNPHFNLVDSKNKLVRTVKKLLLMYSNFKKPAIWPGEPLLPEIVIF